MNSEPDFVKLALAELELRYEGEGNLDADMVKGKVRDLRQTVIDDEATLDSIKANLFEAEEVAKHNKGVLEQWIMIEKQIEIEEMKWLNRDLDVEIF